MKLYIIVSICTTIVIMMLIANNTAKARYESGANIGYSLHEVSTIVKAACNGEINR